MARVLDAQAAVPQVDIAVEPDSSACMTQTAVDPTNVFKPDVEVSTGDFCVLHNTLVYASPKAYAATKVATVHAKTHGDYTRLLPITGSFRANQDLSVVGVAYDGVESAEMAQMYPDARGRVVVQITGTATITMHPLDLDELRVGDLLCLTGEAYDGGLVGNPSVKLPKIAKYARDPFVNAVRLLISRAQNGGVHAPTSALALAAAIFSMHRHRFSAMWNRCTDMLATYHSDLPLKQFADDTDTLAEFVRSAKKEIDDAVDSGMLTQETVAIARVIASLNLTVFDLDNLHQWMQDPPPTVEAFVENLRRHCPASPPFALLLERGHSQARILLQPGAVV